MSILTQAQPRPHATADNSAVDVLALALALVRSTQVSTVQDPVMQRVREFVQAPWLEPAMGLVPDNARELVVRLTLKAIALENAREPALESVVAL